jgi:hypothetical protein
VFPAHAFGEDWDAAVLQFGDLLEKAGGVEDDTVADDICGRLVEDARGDQVEGVLLPGVVVDGVARVGAALFWSSWG